MKIPSLEPRDKVDAKALGANCDNCPLKNCNPVPAKINPNAKLIVLGEAPGNTEEEEGEFFVGESGRFLDKALDSLDISRGDLHISNALLCRPPGKLSPREWQSAIAACQPRLERELRAVPTKFIFGLGARALQTITGKKKITPWLGSIQNGKGTFSQYEGLFSYHPSFIFRPKGNAFVPVFQIWLGYAWSCANKEEKRHTWGRIITNPPFAPHLRKLQKEKAISVDIEFGPISGRIRCIGVGSKTIGISVPLPPEGNASTEDIQALQGLLSNEQIEKVFHNAPSDLREMSKRNWVLKGPVRDTLRAHHIVASQLPHNLSLVHAIEFPGAPNWKSEFKIEGDDKGKVLKRFEKAPLDELLPYNAKDNVAQARLWERLRRRLNETHNGWALYNETIECMLVGLEMTNYGVPVNVAGTVKMKSGAIISVFEKHRTSFKTRRRRAKRELRLIAREVGKENWQTFKLGSVKDLHDLFFTRLGVKPSKWSEETGAASLDEKVIKRVVTSHSQMQSAAARALLRYRKWHKLLSTYVEGLPIESGRVHIGWKEYGTITGRWSSSPNIQNIPKPVTKKRKSDGKKYVVTPGLRDLFCADDGKILIEGDYSQLELRIVAMLAGDEILLKQYANNEDIHTFNAQRFFKTDTPGKDERDISKTFVYACNYGADEVTVWESMVVKFPAVTLTLVAKMMAIWFRDHPKIKQWQYDTVKKVRQLKYVDAPLSGRREHFYLNRIDGGKALNYAVQATGADIINSTVKPVNDGLKKLGGHLLAQVHDALVGQVELAKVAPAMTLMRRYMEQKITLNGYSMLFPVDFKIGFNWGNCLEVKKESEIEGVIKELKKINA